MAEEHPFLFIYNTKIKVKEIYTHVQERIMDISDFHKFTQWASNI